MESNCSTKRSNSCSSPRRAVIVLATPVVPPDASAQAKAGRLVPGGVGETGGAEIRGPDAFAAFVPLESLAALGVSSAPQADSIASTRTARPIRIGQWYGRSPSRVRRGGGTGRRVGLKNRCPQGRAGSTPARGTTPVEDDQGDD